MKTNLLLAAFLLLLLVGCSDDSSSPTDPTTPVEVPLAVATVDAGGGVLEHEGFQLTIPAGVLADGTQLKLFGMDSGTAFGSVEAAPVFRIEGLPAGVMTDLPLRLAHASATGDSLYGLIGGISFVPSLERNAVTWQVVACTDSLGWALFALPAADVAPGRKNATPPVMVTAVRSLAHTMASNDRFRIFWSPRLVEEAHITGLQGYIEEAMTLFDGMGFTQDGFTGWPVQALVRPMPEFGYWSPSRDRLGGYVAFSTDWIADAVEMRLTAGHEILHFCQYFYDPRTVSERGTSAGSLLWIHEATAVAIEDHFAPNPEYVSVVRRGNELTLLDGLLVPAAGRSAGAHGYGQFSLIRYLTQREGNSFILGTYRAIRGGRHAAAALQDSTDTDIPGSWKDILGQLVTGNIYSDVTPALLRGRNLPRLMTISSTADSVGTHTASYADLSGKLYLVRYPGHEFTPGQLAFWCDADLYGLSVFGWNDDQGPIVPLERAHGRVVLGNLPSVQEQYDTLLILVSNQRFAPPNYTGPTSITLQGRLRGSEVTAPYTHGRIRIRYHATWSNGQNSPNQEMVFPEVAGSFSGATFSGTWDDTDAGGTRRWGHVEATFNPADMRVLSWSASNNAEAQDGSGSAFAASGSALPLVSTTFSTLTASIEGVETCSAIGNLTARYYNSAGETTHSLDSYTCNANSFVRVLLYDRSAR